MKKQKQIVTCLFNKAYLNLNGDAFKHNKIQRLWNESLLSTCYTWVNLIDELNQIQNVK